MVLGKETDQDHRDDAADHGAADAIEAFRQHRAALRLHHDKHRQHRGARLLELEAHGQPQRQQGRAQRLADVQPGRAFAGHPVVGDGAPGTAPSAALSG